MSTRFYLPSSGSPPVSPAFGSIWEQTSEAVRRPLQRKATMSAITPMADSTSITVPITTTQDILCAQFVSEGLEPQIILGQDFDTVRAVVKCVEAGVGANCVLSLYCRVVSDDGLTERNFTTENDSTEFDTTASTRTIDAVVAGSLISVVRGDRLVVEIGARTTVPLLALSYTLRFGTEGGSDFALTEGLTTDLNPYIDFPKELIFGDSIGNSGKYVKVEDGMSRNEQAS